MGFLEPRDLFGAVRLYPRGAMNNRRARHGLSTVLSIGALAGLLIWTKLRLVSDLPRSAYAVPHEIEESGSEKDADPTSEKTPERDESDADRISD